MVTNDEVEEKVMADVATFARLTVSRVRQDRKKPLTELGLDHNGLVHLVMSLRAFIKSRRPQSTLLVSEVEKDGFTVDDLNTLVHQRVSP